MNPWHLLWIVPLSASFGCIIAALMCAVKTMMVEQEGE